MNITKILFYVIMALNLIFVLVSIGVVIFYPEIIKF